MYWRRRFGITDELAPFFKSEGWMKTEPVGDSLRGSDAFEDTRHKVAYS